MNRLVAALIATPETARDEVVDAYAAADGNARLAAEFLQVSYGTLMRILRKDSLLRAQITAMRERLAEEGCPQRGWGQWQQEAGR